MESQTGKVIGIGGVFVKCKDPDATVAWYKKYLGIPFDGYGASFPFREGASTDAPGYSVWGPFKADTVYMKPSTKDFMINFRVDDLDAILTRLKAEGVQQVDEVVDEPYGRFAWIMDPDGIKIELWQQIGPPPPPPSGDA
ncbi:VOC family protein [Gimibacter soli]|uniref:VOC family protein n=1 Tax=Gimibacter soli TaxID=3024400 RepID=A0AAE9XKS8_9PROT|nr:VOC family protein [Gimibacter soli]WCL52703.1 VOC family protein [Gimibacter soli]